MFGKRKKTISYDSNNYDKNSTMAQLIYAGKNLKIRKSKIVDTPRKTKTVTYGPVDYYGKQTKTKSIVYK